MSKDILFILKPGFYDGAEGPYYCPDSAAVEGFLKFVPEVEKEIDIRRIDFPRPRKGIVELLGEDNQGSPVLVLDASSDAPAEAQESAETGRAFITDPKEIGDFLARKYGFPRPH